MDFERTLLFHQAVVRRRMAVISEVRTRLAAGGVGDTGVDIADWTRVLDLEKRATDELDTMDRALNRLKDGSYGLCEQCGDAISCLTLEREPWLARCAACDPTS